MITAVGLVSSTVRVTGNTQHGDSKVHVTVP
jgi:hypothetical protein